MTFYFGEKWDAPAFDGSQEIANPGGDCGLCEEPIAEGDSGTLQSFAAVAAGGGAYVVVAGVHIECWLRQGLGSPAHVAGLCSCSGRREPDEHRTWREQGLEVMRVATLRRTARMN